MKTCAKCGAEKPLDAFSTDKKSLDGKHSYCKSPCMAQAKAASRARHGREPSHRDWHLRRTYGITQDDYAAMLAAQNSRCRICRGFETRRDSQGNTRLLSVDHCHASGKVRGLLCSRCNLVIGRMEDNPQLLTAAALYLIESGNGSSAKA